MRLLIVCPCPQERELGAAQAHLNLADALRAQGHVVRVWSPWPPPSGTHWTATETWMREHLGSFLSHEEPFDVVDCPAILIRGRFRQPNVRWVSRSTQPEIPYIMSIRRPRLDGPREAAKAALFTSWYVRTVARIVRGWSVANVIMCLGEADRAWIERRFPWWRSKIRTYENAIGDADGLALARVFHARQPRRPGEAMRYIWIGRWAEHKGTDALVAFLKSRLAARTNEQFTIAGCGAVGARDLAPLVASGRVHLRPTFARVELPALLAEHHAGLFTSRIEGWGLSLNEMVESGLPVYATSAGGVDELRKVLGPFIPPFPPPIEPLPIAPPSDDARARYYARFRWAAIARRYLENVSEVTGMGRPLGR